MKNQEIDIERMQEDGVDENAMKIAIRKDDDSEIASLVNNYNFPVDYFPNGPGSPLSLACELGSLEAAKALVYWGADTQFYQEGLPSPLIIAVQNGHSHIVNWLISQKVDINYYHEDLDHYGNWNWGGSAFSEALRHGHFDIAHLLIEAGSDLDVCIISSNNEVYKHLYPSDTASDTHVFFHCAKHRQYGILKKIVETCKRSGSTPTLLHDEQTLDMIGYCILESDVVILDILTRKTGIEILNKKMPNGLLPLEYATANKNVAIIKTMLEYNTDLLSKTTEGEYLFQLIIHDFPEYSHLVADTLARQLKERLKF